MPLDGSAKKVRGEVAAVPALARVRSRRVRVLAGKHQALVGLPEKEDPGAAGRSVGGKTRTEENPRRNTGHNHEKSLGPLVARAHESR